MGCWGQMRGHMSGNRVEILGERFTPKSALDFCWRGSLSLSHSALPALEGMERKLSLSGKEEANRALERELVNES